MRSSAGNNSEDLAWEDHVSTAPTLEVHMSIKQIWMTYSPSCLVGALLRDLVEDLPHALIILMEWVVVAGGRGSTVTDKLEQDKDSKGKFSIRAAF
mmetsp:Transcript_11451/g.70355  ORF Transcript_11451/g.70355 Transcript_11451/m.70355 type:complete len:96 (+) Transcript_11451:666-953(+)